MSRRQLCGRNIKGHFKRPSLSDISTDNAKRAIPNDFYRDFASQTISDDAEDTESLATDVSTTEDSEEDEALTSAFQNQQPSTSQSTKCKCNAYTLCNNIGELIESQKTLQTTVNDMRKRQNDLHKSLLLELKMMKDSLIEEMKTVRDSVSSLIDFSTHRILFNQSNANNGPEQEDLFVANNVTNDEGYFHR